MADLESDRVERTVATSDMDKFCIAACCFANDFPQHRRPGYLLVGVDNRGLAVGLKVTDKLLLTLGEVRANGNVQPLPAIQVYKITLRDGAGDVAVLEVVPSDLPPVRFKQQVWIRVGPRRQIASESEERILTERRVSHAKTFDARPCLGSSLTDLVPDLFLNTYRQQAVPPEIVAANHRELRSQLASLRFYDLKNECPTNAGILLFAKDPRYWLSGAYVQFLRLAGTRLVPEEVVLEKTVQGDLLSVLRELDLLIDTQLASRPQQSTALQHNAVTDYPRFAVAELAMNAAMHRDYEATGPIRFYWFADRIEIQNPGALYGEASPENFPRQNAYRNPVIAEAMKNLGYVNRYGSGIERAQVALAANANPPAEFDFRTTFFLAILRRRL